MSTNYCSRLCSDLYKYNIKRINPSSEMKGKTRTSHHNYIKIKGNMWGADIETPQNSFITPSPPSLNCYVSSIYSKLDNKYLQAILLLSKTSIILLVVVDWPRVRAKLALEGIAGVGVFLDTRGECDGAGAYTTRQTPHVARTLENKQR